LFFTGWTIQNLGNIFPRLSTSWAFSPSPAFHSGVFDKKSLALSAATFGLCGVLSVWLEDFPDLAPVGLTWAFFLVSPE